MDKKMMIGLITEGQEMCSLMLMTSNAEFCCWVKKMFAYQQYIYHLLLPVLLSTVFFPIPEELIKAPPEGLAMQF